MQDYGVVPKGLLTFLGSIYNEVAKTTSGTLVYRLGRKTARKNSSLEKHGVLDLECRILSQEPSDSCILYFNVYFMESKLKKISINSWWRVNAVIIETLEALETLYFIILRGSIAIF